MRYRAAFRWMMRHVHAPRPGPPLALLAALLVLASVLPCRVWAEEEAGGVAALRVPVAAALRPLRPWLTHDDWTVRSIAAFDLRKRTEPGVVYLAARMLAAENQPYAAAGALGALRGRPRHELVAEGGPLLAEALLRWAGHEHPTLRQYAREVLFSMPPVKLGTQLVRYEGWWKRGRKALEREQRILLRKLAESATPAEKAGKQSTSVEPERKDDRFYGRLEQMRKYGLELCIVMDHTGSMGRVIGAAKVGAQRLIQRLRAYVPRFRAGLVT